MNIENDYIIRTHEVTLYGSIRNHAVTLVPLMDAHLPLLYRWNSDPEVLYWCEEDDVESNDEETVRMIYGHVSQHAFCFLIEVDDLPIGECWLQEMNLPYIRDRYPAGTDIRRIDMMIGEKEWWNKGIGTEVVRLLCDFAFQQEHAELISSFCSDYNLRSCRVFEKNGFRHAFSLPVRDSKKAKEEIWLERWASEERREDGAKQL